MAVEVHKNFKAGLIESIKVAGQMIIDMAEDIAGKSDYIYGLNVSVDFDPEFRSIPKITVTRSHVPSGEKLEYLFNVYDGEKEYNNENY